MTSVHTEEAFEIGIADHLVTHGYHLSEVEQFAKVLFQPKAEMSATDNARLNAAVDPSVDRFRCLDEERQEEFRKDLRGYVRLYSFVSQIVPFVEADLEKLYAFGRMLLRKLPREGTGVPYDFVHEVGLKYYRLVHLGQQDIGLENGLLGEVAGATAVGTGLAKDEEVELSRIIEVLNERFGTDFTPSDQLFFEQVKEDLKANADVVQSAQVNDLDNFRFIIACLLRDVFIDRIEKNESIVQKFLDDDKFRQTVEDLTTPAVYREVRGETTQDAAR